MASIAEHYELLLRQNVVAARARPSYRQQQQPAAGTVADAVLTAALLLVSEERMRRAADATYWKANMVSPVRVHHACGSWLRASRADGQADFLVELGRSGDLTKHFGQIKHERPGNGAPYSAPSEGGANDI
jgi:hypothetical protein